MGERARTFDMRTVRFLWKSRITKARKRDVVAAFKEFYDLVTVEEEYLEIKAPKDDTKFLWLFMLSKAFSDLK